MNTESVDVLVIGAGPAGALAASLLAARQHDVLLIEKSEFPRADSWDTTLLPASMAVLEEAGVLRDVVEAGYQHANGLVLHDGDEPLVFDFRDKATPGWSTGYQLARGDFDEVLVEGSRRAGVDVRFCQEAVALDLSEHEPRVLVREGADGSYTVRARWVIDASGNDRIVPRLSGAEARVTRSFSRRVAWATFESRDGALPLDLHKSYVSFPSGPSGAVTWVRPLAPTRASIGVMYPAASFASELCWQDTAETLTQFIGVTHRHATWLKHAVCVSPVQVFHLSDQTSAPLVGPHWAAIGHAAEWPDPALSSGLASAIESARLVAKVLDRELADGDADWQTDYVQPLRLGAQAFKAHLDALRSPAFRHALQSIHWRCTAARMVCAVLAGYAWDLSNPLVGEGSSERLAHLLRQAQSERAGDLGRGMNIATSTTP